MRQEMSSLVEQDNQLKQQLTEQQSLVSQRKTGTLHDVHAWRQAHRDSWRALRRKRNGALYAELQAMQISVSLERRHSGLQHCSPRFMCRVLPHCACS